MTSYSAPLADMRFVIYELAGLEGIASECGFGEASPELIDAILEEAARFGAQVLAPLNQSGDQEGCVLENGAVSTPEGFRQAYRAFVAGGWNGVPFDPHYGGQGLPWLVSTAVSEIWNSANMAFGLCPMLTQGGVELLGAHASAELKALYLPKMISGEWTGTMNLTEPQAGSDLAAIRTKARRQGGHYLISGQKIFITYGDHDFTDNIVHMVLARIEGAPEGIKGLSLFAVPKFVTQEDGSPGRANDLRCVSLEHKLGIKASPTAVMSYGDGDGAVAHIVGEENRGIEYMFTMMNNARLAVGLEGVAIAERAYQQAHAYSLDRVQGRPLGGGKPAPIASHPDVRRMLLSMKALSEAARALAYFTAGHLDRARRHPEAETRQQSQSLVDLLIPVVKSWGADVGIAVADTAIQVHGGMGYIEETGAAQHLRDARIASIYEGTNGIQALDLVGRKVAGDGGRAALALLAQIRATDSGLAEGEGEPIAAVRRHLQAGAGALERATGWIVETYPDDPGRVAAGAVHYARLAGVVTGGWLMGRAALAAAAKLAAHEGDREFLKAKLNSARFFADQVLTEAGFLASVFMEGASSISGQDHDRH